MIEKHKSGFLPPGDIPFEDLSSQDNVSGSKVVYQDCRLISFSSGNVNASTPQGTPSEKKTSILGTITGGKIKKRSGLLGIFGQNKVHIIQMYSDSISLLNISNAFDYLSWCSSYSNNVSILNPPFLVLNC